MKFLSRLLSFGVAIVGLIALPRLRPSMGLTFPRLLSVSFAPFVIIAGVLGAAMSLLRLDCAGAFAALLGVWAAQHTINRIRARRATFEQAFGRGWDKRIPADLQKRMLKRRFSLPMPQPPAPTLIADVKIGGNGIGEPLLADIWLPAEGIPRTGLAVIYLHGSGFYFLHKDWRTRPLFRQIAGQGHVVIDVAYTLAPRTNIFGMVADTNRAIRWVKNRAADYQINPERIVLMGGSSGGHIALLAAYTQNRPPFDAADVAGDVSVRGVISYYGGGGLGAMVDLHERVAALPPKARWTLNRIAENLVRRLGMLKPAEEYVPLQNVDVRLLGGKPEEMRERVAQASPIPYVGPGCPPTMLVQGDRDSLNDLPGMRALRRALEDAGVPLVYLDLPYVEHAFDLFVPKTSVAFQAAVYDTQRFLALMT